MIWNKPQDEPFSKASVYLEVNKQFIQGVVPHLKGSDCIVDLACGIGTLTEALLPDLRYHATHRGRGSGWPKIRNGAKIIGIDISREALKLAQAHFTQLGVLASCGETSFPPPETPDRVLMMVVEAAGDCLPMPHAVADVVLLGNAIHCFSDKDKLIQEIHRVLKPAGIFAFNSSFYAGTIVEGTERFYAEWLKQALRYVKRREEEWKEQGVGAVFRQRGHGRPAFSNRWLTPSEYQQALEEHGFDVLSVAERSVQMSRHNFESVSAYTATWEAELASVLLSGYPVKLACEALEKAVGFAFAAVAVESVPRVWLEVIGVKR